MAKSTKRVELDGLTVLLYRSPVDGQLVVDIDSSKLEGKDVHKPHDSPNIRIWINEQKIEIESDGSLKEE